MNAIMSSQVSPCLSLDTSQISRGLLLDVYVCFNSNVAYVNVIDSTLGLTRNQKTFDIYSFSFFIIMMYMVSLFLMQLKSL